MAKKTQTITTYTCDLCGSECDEIDGIVEIQVDSGDGRDIGPGYIRGRIAAYLPYRADRGEVCKPCLLKWLDVYVKNQGMTANKN